MKIVKTVKEEDGSTTITLSANEMEADTLLQFAFNFLISTGLAASQYDEEDKEEDDGQLDLFEPTGPAN